MNDNAPICPMIVRAHADRCAAGEVSAYLPTLLRRAAATIEWSHEESYGARRERLAALARVAELQDDLDRLRRQAGLIGIGGRA